ncbi:cytochrome b-c1 complex subunit 6 [Elysia marginata]|uniref:Cytochrome b-c1 complex subunit 6 n=1 Tax=Elysia marginata TaxID=1093978 RepID=A0AAV4EYE1_9GAST|nr:cytochrome b-c1 complex subunit 6 [Elysia marginata]
MVARSEIVALGDPKVEEEEEEPAEEEEEEELVDPQDELKEKCSEKKECVSLKEKLDECNARVEGRSKTAETCTEEIIDFMHCVDHCVSKTLFAKLK